MDRPFTQRPQHGSEWIYHYKVRGRVRYEVDHLGHRLGKECVSPYAIGMEGSNNLVDAYETIGKSTYLAWRRSAVRHKGGVLWRRSRTSLWQS
jgi:hypothetical protein